MKRLLVALAVLGLALGATSSAFAAGSGGKNRTTTGAPGQYAGKPGTATSPTGRNGACNVNKQCAPAGATTRNGTSNNLSPNPASGAGVCNHGQLISQTNGNRTTTPGNGNVSRNNNCTGTGVSTGVSAGTSTQSTTSMSGTTRSNVYSPSNVPSTVPSGSTVSSTAGSTVTYRAPNGTYYHVTYAPNGSYTYTTSSSPTAAGTAAGTTGSPGVAGSYSSTGTSSTGTGSPGVAGSYSSTGTGSAGVAGTAAGGSGTSGASTAGVSGLPTTGGAPGQPAVPVLPGLFGLFLAAAGLALRRLS